MKTYISKLINGYFCTDAVDESYWEGYIGSTLDDFYDGKWVLLSDEQTLFHEENPDASVEEVWEMALSTSYERTLEEAKSQKINDINIYDSSKAVNGFNVVLGNDTITAWFTPTERSNYRSSIEAAELIGLTELSLYIGEMLVTLPVATAKLMLAQIQLYADQCFIITKQHKAAVEALDSIEAVDNYDHTTDYPTKLIFNV